MGKFGEVYLNMKRLNPATIRTCQRCVYFITIKTDSRYTYQDVTIMSL